MVDIEWLSIIVSPIYRGIPNDTKYMNSIEMYIDTKLYYFIRTNSINMEKYIKEVLQEDAMCIDLFSNILDNIHSDTIIIRRPLVSYSEDLRIMVEVYNNNVGNPKEEADKEVRARLASLEKTPKKKIKINGRKLRKPIIKNPSELAGVVICYNKEVGNTKEEAMVDAAVRLFCLGTLKPAKCKRIIAPLMKKYYG